MIGPSLFRHDRFERMDYMHSSIFEPFVLLITLPESSSVSLSAVWKPFQIFVILYFAILKKYTSVIQKYYILNILLLKIWVGLLISIILVTISLKYFSQYTLNFDGSIRKINLYRQQFFMFVVGLLLSQGGRVFF